MELQPIHYFPQYIKETCELLYQQWPISRAHWMKKLILSYDDLPTGLIVVSGGEVLAHSSLKRIKGEPKSGHIVSVVVRPEMRRRGIGTFLIEKTEEYAKRHGMKVLYLETKDMEAFYTKLGYTRCYHLGIADSQIYTLPAFTVNTKETAPGDSACGNDAPCSYSAGALTTPNPAHPSPESPEHDTPAIPAVQPVTFKLMKKELA